MSKDPFDLLQYAHPAKDYSGLAHSFRSPLLRNNGEKVIIAEEWQSRREEILSTWHGYLGRWPELITDPSVEVLKKEQCDGYSRERIRFLWTPNEHTEAWLLIPDGAKNRPGVVTTFYEPETSVGLGTRQDRDFALQLVREGMVCLSIGTTETTANGTYSIYYPDIDNAQVQPLSMLAYAAANAWYVLAAREEVDDSRIGITGHSYGGKWAMFASCLFEKFACAAWSDPAITFDDSLENANYWEPWYLGWHPRPWRKVWSLITEDNPAYGAYPQLRKDGRDLHELHALMAPRPFLVSGGREDPPERWGALQHTVEVNHLLGYQDRVFMTNRPKHEPNPDSNQVLVRFFKHFLSKEMG